MAFLSKVGNMLRQAASKQINNELSAFRPSIYQAIRCMSSSKLFIGGISYSTDEMSLKEAFSKYGEVIEARVIMDRETGRSRGFGFVTYTSSEEASSAIQALDGQDLHGRRIRVNYATDRARGTFGGGFGGGGYGAGGGGGYGAGGGGYGAGGGGYGASGGGYGGASGGYNNNYGGNFGAPGAPGGNYGVDNTGGGGDYASGNYGSGTWNYGSGGGGDDASGNVAYGSGNTNAAENNFGSSNVGADDHLGVGESSSFDDQDEPLEGNFRDDDADDFAKRA